MPLPPSTSALRQSGKSFDVPLALMAWLTGWLLFNLAGAFAVGLGGYGDGDPAPIWVLFVTSVIGWAAFGVALWQLSLRAGSGDPLADYGIAVKPIDVAAAIAGVVTQIALVPLVYLPLEELWPDTFNNSALSENAEDLVARASGIGVVLLVVMVCIGAPVIEELVYRGLMQRSLVGRTGPAVGLVAGAAFFALIHFRPVEYPGLFVAGLVFGAAALATGRLGPAVFAHVGFNVTGLILAS